MAAAAGMFLGKGRLGVAKFCLALAGFFCSVAVLVFVLEYGKNWLRQSILPRC